MIFELSKEEVKKAKEFQKKHLKKCFKKRQPTVGDCFTYSFLPTSIGDFSWIKCNGCKKEEDLNDGSCF